MSDLGHLFFEIHKDLPREGPGSDASTARALDLVRPHLPDAPHIIDVGCGPGAQTRVIADALPSAQLIAFDLHQPFVDATNKLLDGSPKAHAIQADMFEFAPEARVDLVWCEGAAYFMGIPAALERWSGWLEPGGCVAFSEAVWLTDAPSDQPARMWREYPAMGDVAMNLELLDAAGFDHIGHFVLPRADWLVEYYAPMQRRIDALREEYAADPSAQVELDAHQLEVDTCRDFGDEYSYVFLVAKKR